MSLRVFFRSARELAPKEGLILEDDSLRLPEKTCLRLKPLVSLRLPARVIDAERTPCDELLLLTKEGLFCVRNEIPVFLLSIRGEALAVFPGGVFVVKEEEALVFSLPDLRLLQRFPVPRKEFLSAAVRRKRLYLLTSEHEVLVYTLAGRFLTSVRVPAPYRALKASGFLYWFDGENVLFGRKKTPLKDKPSGELFFLPGFGRPWFLTPDGKLFYGEPLGYAPEQGAGLSFELEEEFSGGLLLLLGQGPFSVSLSPEERTLKRVFKLPHYTGRLTVGLRFFETSVLHGIVAVPPARDFLSFLPEAYREGAEEFLLPLLSAFKLFYGAFLKYKEEFLARVATKTGDREELLFLAQMLGFDPQGLPRQDLVSWLSELPGIYRFRGSVKGMKQVLRLLAGEKASLREAFRWREIEREGGPFSRLFGRQGDLFVVFLKPPCPTHRFALVKKTVEEWSPLGTRPLVIRLTFRFALGEPLVLGVNTALCHRDLKIGGSRLGQDSWISNRGLTGRLNLRASLARETQI